MDCLAVVDINIKGLKSQGATMQLSREKNKKLKERNKNGTFQEEVIT